MKIRTELLTLRRVISPRHSQGYFQGSMWELSLQQFQWDFACGLMDDFGFSFLPAFTIQENTQRISSAAAE